jgi:hypothetical protein
MVHGQPSKVVAEKKAKAAALERVITEKDEKQAESRTKAAVAAHNEGLANKASVERKRAEQDKMKAAREQA